MMQISKVREHIVAIRVLAAKAEPHGDTANVLIIIAAALDELNYRVARIEALGVSE